MTYLYRLLVILSCGLSQLLMADDCTPVSQDVTSRITKYLALRITSTSGGVPSILSVSTVQNTCYHKLLIQVSGTLNPLTLYLSPDQRFLTSTLYDLASDPREEASRIAANVEKLLMRDESPRLSGSRPRITVVEFGDLQCPYCRNFASWYQSLPTPLLEETTLIFKHLPLVQHSWARSAALYSACTNQQSTVAFWDLSSYLLTHQDEITPANIKDRVIAALSQTHSVDPEQLVTCATTEAGSSLVDRDSAVAKELAVHSTPTLFIDGRPAPPLHSEEDLRLLLERELRGNLVEVDTGGK
jgi:protein-disulfide isomerase